MTGDAAAFSVRPIFIGCIALPVQLPLQLFFTFWAGGFLGGMSQAAGLFPRGSHLPFIFFGTVAFFGIPAAAYFGKKLNYSQTEYRFLAITLNSRKDSSRSTKKSYGFAM